MIIIKCIYIELLKNRVLTIKQQQETQEDISTE